MPTNNKHRLALILSVFIFPSENFVSGATHQNQFEEEASSGVQVDARLYLSPQQQQDDVESDDRTLLDVFGEVAKEFLTTRVIPDTTETCRWDWRHARCEPFCECRTFWRLGDYHLGRSCRNRTQTADFGDEDNEPPKNCAVRPNSAYAAIWQLVVGRGRRWSSKAKDGAHHTASQVMKSVREARARTCETIPTTCQSAPTRNWKQHLLCNHIPDPCDASFDGPIVDLGIPDLKDFQTVVEGGIGSEDSSS